VQKICIVGLGYVGLPLAHAFAKGGHNVSGYDISSERIEALKQGNDWTNELSKEQFNEVQITFSDDPKIIGESDIVIVALPTPIDLQKKPDLTILKEGTKTVGEYLKKGAIIVYESTVYPGTTEEICAPILEEASRLKCGQDFTLGYSPERVNPGDKEHSVDKIVKVVSGQDEKTTDTLVELYGSVITAGIHRAPSIKVAEMAKAIENAQRDLNIAFVNEIALLCDKVGIPTQDVLNAAKTKWNFLPFLPGLVGGHCIGVDPYYLVEKARQLGMETQVIAAGRAVNDSMGKHVANQILNSLPGECREPRVLVLGITFKENVPDTRNSKSGDVIKELQERGCTVEVDDPYRNGMHDWKAGSLNDGPYDAIVLLVPHREYLEQSVEMFTNALQPHGIIYDLKGMLNGQYFAQKGRRHIVL